MLSIRAEKIKFFGCQFSDSNVSLYSIVAELEGAPQVTNP